MFLAGAEVPVSRCGTELAIAVCVATDQTDVGVFAWGLLNVKAAPIAGADT